MKVAITGYSGFIGKKLSNFLTIHQIEILNIERQWLYQSPEYLAKQIEGSDAIINLAGAPIIKRWNRKYKIAIYQSRVKTTRNLVQAISLCKERPKHLISASAIGIYDDIHKHDEYSSYFSTSYLGKVCKNWESAALYAQNFGLRVSIVRLGIVLGHEGGMLKKVLPLFKIGLGSIIGSGKQSMSFIHIDDLINIIYKLLTNNLESSIYNATTPYPTTNKEFTETLTKKLKRPQILFIPKFILNLIYGEGAQVLTSGQYVLPAKLLEQNFKFQYTTIDEVLDAIIKSKTYTTLDSKIK
ncbi:MAG: TIGR01777 family oxidoreductase [Bacteroidales bacterium]